MTIQVFQEKTNAKCGHCGKEWKTQNRAEPYCSMICRFEARKEKKNGEDQAGRADTRPGER